MSAPGDDQQQTQPEPAAAGQPLAAGTPIGEYVVVRLLSTAPDGATYLARRAASGAAGAGQAPAGNLPDVFVHLVAGRTGAHDEVRPIIARDLHHARLLVPRAIVAVGDTDYLVVEACEDETTAGAPGDAMRPLDATAVLSAGVGLADALAYLHRSGAAHLHVMPDAIRRCGERIFLAGVQTAQLVHPADPDAPRFYARDANFLARTLGALTELPGDAASVPDPSAAAVAAIVERGAANEFTTPAEVGAICGAALPQLDLAIPEEQPAAAVKGLSFTVATTMSVGRVRSENQDAAAAVLFEVRDDLHAGAVSSSPAGLFLVADGMGGEARGDLASRIAARVMVTEVTRELLLPVIHTPVRSAQVGTNNAEAVLPNLAVALRQAVLKTNSEVRKLAAVLGKTSGTTLTAIVAVGTRAAFAHVGDSRAYLLRAGKVSQITEDHTLLARLQSIGHPILDDPNIIVPRSFLYRSLGSDDNLDVDAGEFGLEPGDRLLICSDGLWDEVDPALLESALATATTPQQCGEILVQAANEAGGQDNSTVVAIFVGGERTAPATPPADGASKTRPGSASPDSTGGVPA
ncbi:MAG TPA: protein phosphatase 2C domain-containing protein [Ktedonobacterales bacterium]|nr:protein phosphatase 2C domain-containing protein [Ktedonobacterales bacterium]